MDEGAYVYRVIAVADGMQSDPSDPALVTVVGVDLRTDLTGTISGTRTLNADSIYILRGIVDGGRRSRTAHPGGYPAPG